ncbi:SLH domain protein [Peptostreptococcaceae bacterium AS15]|nr:SLH domain protein [Peptostreptococcaceae bacterium AS15]
MSKKINKKRSIADTKKGICCTLLATGLILQTCSYPVFADSSSQNTSNTSSILAKITSQSDLQALNDRIGQLEAPTQAEDGNIIINEHSLKLNVGDEFQLRLLDSDGNDVNDVEWFVRERTPQDIVYTAEEYSKLSKVISLDKGLVKAKTRGNAEIWAKKADALYKCTVIVEYDKDSELEKKVDEIADKFRHLSSDADKLMAVHDYLVENIEYSSEHIVSYAYGALIEGKAVCQGYSQSFQKIIDKLNIKGYALKGWSTAAKPEFHQWNRVKLDDGWYFIDVTWDDLPEREYISYKHFLINSETLGKNHKDWYASDEEVDGSKYTYYAYKKQGEFANNKEELEQVLRAQINSTNLPYTTIRVAIPKSMDDGEILNTVKKITGGNPYINEIHRLRDTFGTHKFYSYEISNIPTQAEKNVSLLEVKPTNNVNETTTSVMLTFDQNIDDLTVNDIKMDEVYKTGVNKIDNKTYELRFKDMMFRSTKTLPIEVSKRGFNISNSRQNVDITIVKEETPQAVFKATGDKKGRLENVERGMRYDLGDGVWHDINSSEPVEVTTKYQEPILLIKQSTTAPILNSDVQKILPIETVSPLNIKSVDSVEGKNNGKIIYVNSKMEYKKDGSQNWIACTGKEVTGLSEGKYLVRYKPNGLKLASHPIEVEINVVTEEKNKPNPQPEIQKPGQENKEENKPNKESQDSKTDSKKTPEEEKPNKKEDKKETQKAEQKEEQKPKQKAEEKEIQKPKEKEEKSSSGGGGGGSSSSSKSSSSSGGGGGTSSTSKSVKEQNKISEKDVQKTAETITKLTNQESEQKNQQEKSQLSQQNQEISKEIKLPDIMTMQEAQKTVDKLKDTRQITWSKQAVTKLMQKGIMSGDKKGNFMPKKAVTRAEVAQVITNIIGEKPSSIKVADVSNNKWYAKAVQTVLENKIFSQDKKAKFRPDSNITRAELFVAVAKLKDIKPLDKAKAKEVLSKYKDADSTPAWAIGYVSALVEKGIVSGANNKLNANDTLTREQLSTIFANIIE